jgi:hypothetical protein
MSVEIFLQFYVLIRTYIFIARFVIKIKDTFYLMETQIQFICQAKNTPYEVIHIAIIWRIFGIYFESLYAKP